MKKFLIIASIFFLAQFSCESEDADSCIEMRSQEWQEEAFKPDFTIEFPDDYEGVGMTGFEGPIFFKNRIDSSVLLSYYYCSPLYCEAFGDTLSNIEIESFEFIDQDGSVFLLDQKIEFCRNSETEAFLFHNSTDWTRGIYFMNPDEAWQEALRLEFDNKEINEVVKILGTISDNP